MKGIDIKIIENDTGLFITNLGQSKGIEFSYVKFRNERKTLESAEKLGSVTLPKDDFIKLSNYFNLCVEQLMEEQVKEESTTVEFFEQTQTVLEEPVKKQSNKKVNKKKND